MNKMLEFYQSRYGSAVKIQGDAYNGPCPLCGGDIGKSDRFMIWTDKSDDIGHTCQINNISGVCWCRRCGFSGDSIEYLQKCENLSFKEALHELGIHETKKSYQRRRIAPMKQVQKNEYTPKERDLPSEKWSEYAHKILEEAKETIWDFKEALKWLAARGIDDTAIRRYQIGYLKGENGKQGRYRARSALGLSVKTRKDGTQTNRIFIPRGIVIPSFHNDKIISLRIRRPKKDIQATASGYTPPKYMELEGSAKMPLCLLPQDQTSMLLIPFVVVESELDAMLCHYATHEQVGVIALRSNQNKPCPFTHELLSKTPRILLAMDYEDNHAGIAGLDFWEKNYPQIKRWPTPEGKDAGEAVSLGVDICEWISLGLPASFRFTHNTETHKNIITETQVFNSDTQYNRQNSGHMDTSFSGVNTEGVGERKTLLIAMECALAEWEFVNDVKLSYVGGGRFKRKFPYGIVPCFNEEHLKKLERFMFEERHLKEWWEEHKNYWISIQVFIGELEEIKKSKKH